MKELIFSYLGTLGLAGLAAGIFVEAMGFPFPGGLFIILTGFLVNQGKLNFYQTIGTIFVSFNLGSLVAYYVGKNTGNPFFSHFGKYFRIDLQRFQEAQDWLDRSAVFLIVVGRFIPWVGNLTPFLAGASNIRVARFLFYNSIFVTGWALFYLYIGMFFGNRLASIFSFLNERLPLIGIIIINLFLVVAFIFIWRRGKNKYSLSISAKYAPKTFWKNKNNK